MPYTYYVSAGTLESYHAAYPGSIGHVPKDVLEKLLEWHIQVDSDQARTIYPGEIFDTHASKLPDNPRFFKYTYLHESNKFFYRLTTNLEDAVKAAGEAYTTGTSDSAHLMPIFEIEVDKKLDPSLLSYANAGLVQQEKMLFPSYEIKNIYLKGYYHIGDDYYEYYSLRRKAKPYEYGEREILLLFLTAFTLIIPIIYLFYRLYKSNERETAEALIKQTETYLDYDNNLVVIKGSSQEDKAFAQYVQKKPNTTLHRRIYWNDLKNPPKNLLRLLDLVPSDLTNKNPDLVMKKFIIKAYGLTTLTGTELDESEITCNFSDTTNTIKIHMNEDDNAEKISKHFSKSIVNPDVFDSTYTCQFISTGVVLADFQHKTEDLFYQSFGPKENSSTFTAPLQQPKPVDYNAFCNEVKKSLPTMWHPLFERLKEIGGVNDNQTKAMNRILGFIVQHHKNLGDLESILKKYATSNDENFLNKIYFIWRKDAIAALAFEKLPEDFSKKNLDKNNVVPSLISLAYHDKTIQKETAKEILSTINAIFSPHTPVKTHESYTNYLTTLRKKSGLASGDGMIFNTDKIADFFVEKMTQNWQLADTPNPRTQKQLIDAQVVGAINKIGFIQLQYFDKESFFEQLMAHDGAKDEPRIAIPKLFELNQKQDQTEFHVEIKNFQNALNTDIKAIFDPLLKEEKATLEELQRFDQVLVEETMKRATPSSSAKPYQYS